MRPTAPSQWAVPTSSSPATTPIRTPTLCPRTWVCPSIRPTTTTCTNNLGWFASDRYQPADKVCVYVFIPNASKQVYDYDTTDKDRLVRLASLKDISLTWADTTLVADARRRLASAIAGKPQVKKQKRDFEFLINDETTYYLLSDFRSPQAKTLFGKYRQLEQSFAQQSEKLEKGRRKYAEASAEEKKQLAPAILDLEQRILTLRKEVNEAAKAVRRAEAGVQ